MTRAEELDWIYRLRSNIYVYMPKEWLIPMDNALGAAIKALEKEPCEDAISRKAVVEYIKASDAELGHDSENEFAVEDILNMPPVTPTRKKGKWVIKASGFPPEPMTVCSECGFDKDFYIRGLTYDKLKYCPICGAEMESEE